MSSSITGLSGSSTSSSGIDVSAVVEQLMYVERAPERLMQAQQAVLQRQTTALKDLQSRLTSLQSAVETLNDLSGAFNQRSVQSGDSSVFRVSASSDAKIASHTIEVNRLASTSTFHSKALDGASSEFTAGTSFTFAIGDEDPVTINFDASHHTLTKAAEYINSLDAGMAASVITGANGAQLVLTSSTSGAAGQITITNDTTGLNLEEGSKGQNAQVILDGIPVESATNTVEGAIPSITLNLISADSGRSIVFQTSRDTNGASAAVQRYVSAFNDVMTAVNNQFTYDVSTKSSGVLTSDPTVRILQQQLFTLATRSPGDDAAISSLGQLGVTMGNDGKLTLDTSKLSSALTDNFEGVEQFFHKASSGFAVLASADLDDLTDSLSGPIASDLSGIDATSRNISKSIDAFEVRMTAREKQLTDQYTRIDVMMRQFSALQSQVATQLASLPKVSQ